MVLYSLVPVFVQNFNFLLKYTKSVRPTASITSHSHAYVRTNMYNSNTNRKYSNMSNEWIIIGISGVTCGGKTTLANRLKESLVPVYIFHQDKYFYLDDNPKHVRCKNLDHNNYDIVSALDMKQMHEDLVRTMKGESRAHEQCTERGQGKWEVPGKSFIVLEGFTVLNYKPLLELCNLRYYFVLEYGECAARRALRLYDPPDVPGYFEECVWPEHLRYRAEIESDPRVQLLDGAAGGVGGDGAVATVLADVAALGATRCA